MSRGNKTSGHSVTLRRRNTLQRPREKVNWVSRDQLETRVAGDIPKVGQKTCLFCVLYLCCMTTGTSVLSVLLHIIVKRHVSCCSNQKPEQILIEVLGLISHISSTFLEENACKYYEAVTY